MAQKVIVELVDDLDGSKTDDISTIDFGLDGVRYAIDLSGGNAERLRKTLEDYVTVARRAGGRLKSSGTAPKTRVKTSEETRAIREWARTNGFDIGDRGRIPGAVQVAFERAQSGKSSQAKPMRRR